MQHLVGLEPDNRQSSSKNRGDELGHPHGSEVERIPHDWQKQQHSEQREGCPEDPLDGRVPPLTKRADNGQPPRPVDHDQAEVGQHQSGEGQ